MKSEIEIFNYWIKDDSDLTPANVLNAIVMALEQPNYWKKRCEAAEENIKTYSDWNTDRLDVDRMSSTSDVLFLKWKAAFDNWQQLKSQKS